MQPDATKPPSAFEEEVTSSGISILTFQLTQTVHSLPVSMQCSSLASEFVSKTLHSPYGADALCVQFVVREDIPHHHAARIQGSVFSDGSDDPSWRVQQEHHTGVRKRN